MLALVADSSADLTREEARRLGCEVVPMTYTLDGTVRTEGFMGENGDVAAAIEGGRITGTEGVRTEAFAATFRTLAGRGDDVLCITISSKLSGTYRHACEAADAVRSELRRAAGATSREANSAAAARTAGLPRVAVLDSCSGISGMEFLVRAARRLADAGEGFDAVYAALERRRDAQGLCFSVPDTQALRASGRMAMVPLSVNTLLNRFPILTTQGGSIRHVGTAHGTSALAREMAARVPEDAEEAVITHFGARGQAAGELLRTLRETRPALQVRVKEGGPVLSHILGAGALSLAWDPR